MIRALTDAAWSTVDYYASHVRPGRHKRRNAKQEAIENLRHVRFGPEGKDYFWINDMQPRIIMHPYRPDLEGMDTSDLTDRQASTFLWRLPTRSAARAPDTSITVAVAGRPGPNR